MKILWVLHHPWETLAGQREHHLIQYLKKSHEIHVITWSHNNKRSRVNFLKPSYYKKSLRFETKEVDGITLHHIPLLPNLSNFIARNKIHSFWPNRVLYQTILKALGRKNQYDALIYGTNHWLLGNPPKNIAKHYVFDYLDSYPDEMAENILHYSDTVLCVSHFLKKQADRYHSKVYYSPNGVHPERFASSISMDKAKEKFGWQGQKIISLIGLTCSPDFYFIDAMKIVQETDPSCLFLFVGGGDTSEKLKADCEKKGVRYHSTGWIDHEDIQDYYAATDVGLYPGELTHVYDGACPLKVLEYAASQRPIVCSPSWELENLNFPNLFTAGIEPENFAEGIKKALNYSGPYPEMGKYHWSTIGDELIQIISS